jgi:phosphonate degradation associated HDIG domain protein
MSHSKILTEIITVFQERGDRSYGEDVTEREHALQCATFAQMFNSSPGVVLAALLHDIGHLLHHFGENIAQDGVDAEHEQLGANWLQNHFPAEVVEPIRLHVAAKRYLCGQSPEYLAGLSDASRQSLMLQGGPMPLAEQVQFEQHPHFSNAIQVRRFDDMGKVPAMVTANLDSYYDLIESFLRPNLLN